LKEAVSRLEGMLKKETERVGEMWRMNCAQVYAFDEAITAKDSEIETLRAKVDELQAPPGSPPMDSTATVPERRPFIHPPMPGTHTDITPVVTHSVHASGLTRRGKAPPVNEFSGEDPDILLDDWLPSLKRASQWNAWSEED